MSKPNFDQCGLSDENGYTLIGLPHDPCPVKVKYRTTGGHITTLPMSALSAPEHHFPHELHEFAPGDGFCKQAAHYFAPVDQTSSRAGDDS